VFAGEPAAESGTLTVSGRFRGARFQRAFSVGHVGNGTLETCPALGTIIAAFAVVFPDPGNGRKRCFLATRPFGVFPFLIKIGSP